MTPPNFSLPTKDLAQKLRDRIVEVVDDTLLQRNDRVVRDVDVLGADFGTALGDVAIAEAELLLQESGPGRAVEWVHLERGDPHEETGAAELPLLSVVPQNVADVLTEEALDALAELLHAVDVGLRHLPARAWARGKRRDLAVDFVVPRDVRHEVAGDGKRLHRRHDHRLIERKSVHPGLAREPRATVDFRRTGAAFARLAVPAHGEVRREVALNVVERIENDHPGRDGDPVLDELASLARPAEDFQESFGHRSGPLGQQGREIRRQLRDRALREIHRITAA